MKRSSRIATLVVLVAAHVSFFVAPALATEGTEEETSTTVAEEPAPASGVEPAVPMTTPEPTESLPDPAGLDRAVSPEGSQGPTPLPRPTTDLPSRQT
jgi:hypothetical protein